MADIFFIKIIGDNWILLVVIFSIIAISIIHGITNMKKKSKELNDKVRKMGYKILGESYTLKPFARKSDLILGKNRISFAGSSSATNIFYIKKEMDINVSEATYIKNNGFNSIGLLKNSQMTMLNLLFKTTFDKSAKQDNVNIYFSEEGFLNSNFTKELDLKENEFICITKTGICKAYQIKPFSKENLEQWILNSEKDLDKIHNILNNN